MESATSEGQRKLRETGVGLREMGRRLGCSAPSVSRYLKGESRPEPKLRKRIQTEFGIPLTDWDVTTGGAAIFSSAPAAPAPKPSKGRPPAPPKPKEPVRPRYSEPEEPPPPPPRDKRARPVPPVGDDLREQLRYHLDEVRWMRAEAEAEGQLDFVLKLLKLEEDAMMDLAKFTRELTPADESRLCETSAWLDLRGRIVRAVLPYPEATRALLEALGE